MNIRFFTVGAFLVATSAAAWAASGSPHFVQGPTASLSDVGDYVVSFKEAGLGNTPITYALTADETFTFQCYNPANNQPHGAPNGVSFSDATQYVTIQPRNGQITGSVMLSPEKGNASCQGKAMTLCLIAVSYTDVQFTETTTPLGPYSMPSLSRDFSANPICGF